MPIPNNIHKILIIGSGPVIIGQAGEYDCSATQACRVLKSNGFETVVVNSNPATVMSDPETADVTYIEPLNPQVLEEIIASEQPDAVLPVLGGQSALNLTLELDRKGILKRYGVGILGSPPAAIECSENHSVFKHTMDQLGIEVPSSRAVNTEAAALEMADELGFPVVVRPPYTMGGSGGGAGLQP